MNNHTNEVFLYKLYTKKKKLIDLGCDNGSTQKIQIWV